MGGNMQFTIGTSAQFTLGQSFEISIGPPKIEIHTSYGSHIVTLILCGLLGGVATAFLIAYDVIAHKERHTVFPQGYDPTTPDAKTNEQPGDKERATLVLVYQLAMDALLTSILASESVYDRLGWFADDLLKTVTDADTSILNLYTAPDVKPSPPVPPGWWENWGQLTFGATAETLVIAAEIAAEAAIPPTDN